MDFFVIFLAAMTLPGAVLSRLMGLDANRAGVSIALSLSVLVLLLTLARTVGLGAAGFGYLLLASYVVIGVGALWGWRTGRLRLPNISCFDSIHLIPTLTLGLVVGYVIWAGPYMEVPADIWWHIGQINDRVEEIATGNIGPIGALEEVFSKSTKCWYIIVAFFINLTGINLESVAKYLVAANTLLFSAGIYSFALFVFGRVVTSQRARHFIAAASVFFFIAQFGISAFSYVRYYVFAPAFLNYVVYLSAIACLLKYLDMNGGGYRFVVIAVIFLGVAAMLHAQEALFIIVMSGAILLVGFLRITTGVSLMRIPETGVNNRTGRTRLSVLFWSFVAVYVMIHAAAYFLIARHDPLAFGLMADIHDYVPFLQNLFILKPTYQFYQVVTVWGVLVYVLFLLSIKRFISTPYFLAAMGMPLLTVFNPIFTDLFLRLSSPTTLWRMCYMLPLPFLGGYFFIKGVEDGLQSRNLKQRIGGLLVAASLLFMLLPIQSIFFVSPYSKIHMLAPVSAGNDHRLWNDLLEFLSNEDESSIITDRVTGYVINGLSKHKYRGHKFYGLYSSRVNEDSYDDEEFKTKTGWKKLVRDRDFKTKRDWMVVINRRDGAPSATGRYGKHWPEDILKVSKQYSKRFINYVNDHPEMFKEIWRHNGITVYRITSA